MVKTLVIQKDGECREADRYIEQVPPGAVLWMHLVRTEDKIIDAVVDEVKQGKAFEEDLLEEQRPRLTNLGSHSVIVIRAPAKDMLETDDPEDGVIQLSFIVHKNKLISVSSRHYDVIDRIFERLQKRKMSSASVTSILSYILEQTIENVIDVIELFEKAIDKIQSKMIKAKDFEELLEEVQAIKENIFFANKVLRANLEVVRELQFGKAIFIRTDKFNEHIEDRLLYSLDILETAHESINGINSLYMAAISNKMNEHMYRLTVMGAFLLIPAAVAALWGMNVPLPINNFWIVLGMSFVLALLLVIWVKISK
ncbi:MAG: magnesium transporter CorA family protein [archaeon]